MKYTLITGASSGIGKELAYTYAKNGHHLILVARRKNLLETLKEELEKQYLVNVLVYSCDLNDLSQVKNVFEDINNAYDIDCLINNAGIGNFELVGDLSVDTISSQISVNLTSPILTTNILLANLKQNKGSVINVCSILSFIPNIKSSVYTASKFALYGFSNVLRLENPDLHVLTIHPITVTTPFFSDPNYLKTVKNQLDPKLVAKKIYHSYKKRKRICHVPRISGLVNILYQFFPKTLDYLNRKYFANK